MDVHSGFAITFSLSLFKWFRGAKSHAAARRQPAASTENFPRSVEVIPGKLKVRLFLHEIKYEQEMIPCWSYVSDGFLAHRQKEIIFTLRRDAGQNPEDYPRQLLDLFAIIFHYAQQGVVVDEGESTLFGENGFLGDRDFSGIGYVGPEGLSGVETGGLPRLAAILLKGDEAQIVWKFGLTRVTALLGQKYHYYPYPTWSDLKRQPVVSLRAMDKSILAQVLRIVARASYYEEQNSIFLSILPSGREHLQRLLRELLPTQPVALHTQPDPRANACLVWHPTHDKPMAIARPNSSGSRMTGAFLAFVPEQDVNKIQMAEDGYFLLLTNNSWQKIREALLSGTNVSVPLTEGPEANIVVEWADTAYTSPVTGEIYTTERWIRYKPDTALPQRTLRPERLVAVSRGRVVLLTREGDLEMRTTVEGLGSYINAIAKAVDTVFYALEPRTPRELTIQLALTVACHEVRMIAVPDLTAEVAEDLRHRLENVPAPRVLGPVKLDCYLGIWGPASKQ